MTLQITPDPTVTRAAHTSGRCTKPKHAPEPVASVTKSPMDYNRTPASTGSSFWYVSGTSFYRAAGAPCDHLHLRLGGVCGWDARRRGTRPDSTDREWLVRGADGCGDGLSGCARRKPLPGGCLKRPPERASQGTGVRDGGLCLQRGRSSERSREEIPI